MSLSVSLRCIERERDVPPRAGMLRAAQYLADLGIGDPCNRWVMMLSLILLTDPANPHLAGTEGVSIHTGPYLV
jgi:hypothetical protein